MIEKCLVSYRGLISDKFSTYYYKSSLQFVLTWYEFLRGLKLVSFTKQKIYKNDKSILSEKKALKKIVRNIGVILITLVILFSLLSLNLLIIPFTAMHV